METENIRALLNTNIVEDIEDYKNFHIGEFIEKPNQCGCFKRNQNWYTYETDEKNYCSFSGPFNIHGVIGAISMMLPVTMKTEEFDFTDEEFLTYVNNHFHTFAEIDEFIERA